LTEVVQELPYNYTADLWSLGVWFNFSFSGIQVHHFFFIKQVILYELHQGTPPFYTNNLYSLIHQIVQNPVVFPKDISPDFFSFLKVCCLFQNQTNFFKKKTLLFRDFWTRLQENDWLGHDLLSTRSSQMPILLVMNWQVSHSHGEYPKVFLRASPLEMVGKILEQKEKEYLL